MSKLFRRIARVLAPDLMDRDQVETMIEAKVREARMAIPGSLDYDPNNEGYRRYSAENLMRRDLTPMGQDLMFELAYYLYDTSGMVKRFVRDTKNFILGEGVQYTVENDEKGLAKEWIDKFWNDSVNLMDLRLEKRVEFLGLLGEQCWPVQVNPYNGFVRLGYVDPANVDDVMVSESFPELAASVRLKGLGGRSGQVLSVIREEWDPRRREFGRLTGECFFFSLNNPPNGPRGRSDLISSFDYINAFEESLFDETDRVKLMKAFIWDATLQGATDEEIIDFLKHNKAPRPGSVRAHNERVTWQAVAPDLKMQDSKTFFDFLKSYLAACQNRPDSWLGSGGKAYQNEADLMGEPTFKDLASRQRYVQYMIEYVLRFVIDQAVLKGALTESEKKRFTVRVTMPEMASKFVKQVIDGIFTLAQALVIAESQAWVTKDTAAKIFSAVAQRVGIEIDAAEEVRKAAERTVSDGGITEDYAAREALIHEIVSRMGLGGRRKILDAGA